MCNRIAVEAFTAAGDAARWPEHGPAWQAAKLYYHMGFHRRRYEQLERIMHASGLDCEFPFFDEDPYSYGRLTTFVDCAEFFPVRDEALRAHATQIDPDGPWFAVPLAIQQAGWPTEDYQLVVSKVPTMIPEDDLFAGLRPEPLVPEFII
jgi:mycothiol S-conjugate amidase